jgi:hypothetical protein
MNDKGQRLENPVEIENAFLEFFPNLFTRGLMGDLVSCL